MQEIYTIDVDTGGTFTDILVSDRHSGQHYEIKVETTPDDYLRCLLKAVDQSAEEMGISTEELLTQTSIFRYSSTIATNLVLQKNGPRLGALVSAGSESSLYASDGESREELSAILPPELVIGVEEAVDKTGVCLQTIDPDLVVRNVEWLLERGIRGLVIAFANSHLNDTNEQAVRRAVNIAYPRHCLGGIPSLVSSRASGVASDFERLASATLNLYIRPGMVRFLYRADESLRAMGLRQPLLVVNGAGGCAKVSRTSPLATYNSGPAAGILGTSRFNRRLYGESRVLTADVGGTTIDVGVIESDADPLGDVTLVEGLRIPQRSVQVEAVSGGGGAIVSLDADGEVVVGPESAGAFPGPMAYGLGGRRVTLTDVDIVIGVLDPNYYFGGKRQLQAEHAYAGIKEQFADPWGVDVVVAADRLRRGAERHLGRIVAGAVSALGDAAVDETWTVAAFGGGGGLRAAALVGELGAGRARVYPFASVMCAAGSAVAPVRHEYESVRKWATAESVAQALSEMESRAVRDMAGEGFGPSEATWKWHFAFEDGSQLDCGAASALAVLQIVEPRLSKASVTRMRCIISCELPQLKIVPRAERGAFVERAKRPLYWDGVWHEMPVFEWETLAGGFRHAGPTVIESPHMTVLVPTQWVVTSDEFGTLDITRIARSA